MEKTQGSNSSIRRIPLVAMASILRFLPESGWTNKALLSAESSVLLSTLHDDELGTDPSPHQEVLTMFRGVWPCRKYDFFNISHKEQDISWIA